MAAKQTRGWNSLTRVKRCGPRYGWTWCRKIDEAERARRWQQLADIYLAQQLSNYPPDYFLPEPTVEKLLETVERFEEDLTDNVRVHRPIHTVIKVGDAIEVPPGRERGTQGDSLMAQVRHQLEAMLEELRGHRPEKGAA